MCMFCIDPDSVGHLLFNYTMAKVCVEFSGLGSWGYLPPELFWKILVLGNLEGKIQTVGLGALSWAI